jgi:hypothetical protein
MPSPAVISLIKKLLEALKPFAQMSSLPRVKRNKALPAAIKNAQEVYDKTKDLSFLK